MDEPTMEDLSALQFDAQGLIPAIVQDAASGQVLMLGYMNRESIAQTLATGLVHFWSRARGQLWQKGETSGHIQHVREIRYDCDADTVLTLVDQEGAACHTGERSCFFHLLPGSPHLNNPPTPPSPSEGGGAITSPSPSMGEGQGGGEALLHRLYEVILDRKHRLPQESYVASLFARGQDQVLKKVIEEAAEVTLASKDGRPAEILQEMADLWFHTLVVLGWHNLPPQKVLQELQRRFGVSGLRSPQPAVDGGPSKQSP